MDKKTIKKLIGKFDKKQLQELVTYIVSKSEQAREALLDYCQKNDTNTETDNHTLLIENKIQQCWQKVAPIIAEFDMYGGGPESDEDKVYATLRNMEELLEDAEISWTIRKEILDQMLNFVKLDNSGFADPLMDVAFVMCKNKQENIYLADFLIENASHYYQGIASEIYLENGEDQKFIESKNISLKYGSDYLELAHYYKKYNDEKKALKIVLEGLDKADGRLDEIYEYLFQYYKKNKDEAALEKLYAGAEKRIMNQDTITELMYNYYLEKGDYEKKKNVLLKWISCCDIKQLNELYQKCIQELLDEDFQKNETKILSIIKKRHLPAYFDILINKGETKEVMEYITQSQPGLDHQHYFSKQLSNEYPREIVEMYWKETAFYVSLGKEHNYSHAVSLLKEICQIMKKNNWTEEWNIRYKAFLEEHKRKKLLLRLLENFKA